MSEQSIDHAAWASGESSCSKARISPGIGGRPIRSKEARRIQARRSASAAGFRPASSSFARMNRSIGSSGQDGSRTAGGSADRTGCQAQ
ncbi:MAG: hypothetical protein U0800_13555 [Isosphaeraceae bacterium]